MRFALALAALAVLAGCDSNDPSQLELVVGQTRFTAGDEVLVVLDNDTGEDRSYASCGLVLFRVVSQRNWAAVDPESEFCEDVAQPIRAGVSVPFRLDLDPALEAGTYAIGLQVSSDQSPGVGFPVVYTGRFEVAAAQ